jgi:hypothetical protein
MATRNVIIIEFAVQIYADGRIEWDGLDEFLWWQSHRKPREGFEPHANKISTFGRPRRFNRKSKLPNS